MTYKKLPFIIAIILISILFIICTFQYRELKANNLFISNTVGNNLLQMNRLYSLLRASHPEYGQEQVNFNRDMLTIIDCGNFIKDVDIYSSGKNAAYFVKGLKISLQTLSEYGVEQKNLVLCNGKVLKLANEKQP